MTDFLWTITQGRESTRHSLAAAFTGSPPASFQLSFVAKRRTSLRMSPCVSGESSRGCSIIGISGFVVPFEGLTDLVPGLSPAVLDGLEEVRFRIIFAASRRGACFWWGFAFGRLWGCRRKR